MSENADTIREAAEALSDAIDTLSSIEGVA